MTYQEVAGKIIEENDEIGEYSDVNMHLFRENDRASKGGCMMRWMCWLLPGYSKNQAKRYASVRESSHSTKSTTRRSRKYFDKCVRNKKLSAKRESLWRSLSKFVESSKDWWTETTKGMRKSPKIKNLVFHFYSLRSSIPARAKYSSKLTEKWLTRWGSFWEETWM